MYWLLVVLALEREEDGAGQEEDRAGQEEDGAGQEEDGSVSLWRTTAWFCWIATRQSLRVSSILAFVNVNVSREAQMNAYRQWNTCSLAKGAWVIHCNYKDGDIFAQSLQYTYQPFTSLSWYSLALPLPLTGAEGHNRTAPINSTCLDSLHVHHWTTYWVSSHHLLGVFLVDPCW